MVRPLYENGGAGLTPEQQALKAQAAQVVTGINLHPTLPADTSKLPDFTNMKQRASDIADAALQQDRSKVLEFLGIDQAKPGKLYYFVSWSMPESLLRSYALQAMWDGGILVFKGIDADTDVRTFIVKKMMPLVQFKGGSAEITLDPRMYDMYKIDTVPAIVYSEVPDLDICQAITQHPFSYDDKQLQYTECAAADPAKYWKIGGAVTTDYALDSFIAAGATGAQRYKDVLAKASITGIPESNDGKSQAGFTGKWDQVITPATLAAINGTLSKGMNSDTYVFPTGDNSFGLATGPKGLSAVVNGNQVMVPVSQMPKQPAN
jgi:type-F conjugative transfer system pilin assembly protein TrbC